LSDSTVLRNLGVALGYCLVAYDSALKGISKLELNRPALQGDLSNAWEVLAEAVQTVMRKHGMKEPYEALKQATRGRQLDQTSFVQLLTALPLPDDARATLAKLTPQEYVGLAADLAKQLDHAGPCHQSRMVALQTELRAIRERVFIDEQGVPRCWNGTTDDAADILSRWTRRTGAETAIASDGADRRMANGEHRDRGSVKLSTRQFGMQ
jgi:hypothetical protein